jgi:hypothetical protein
MSSNNNKVANFRRNWINGTNYSLVKKSGGNWRTPSLYRLTHKPSKAYVEFNVDETVYISYGETPKNARGRGIGTKLRALVTLFGIEFKKPVFQYGTFINVPKVGLPPSTRILQRLGYSHNKITNSQINSLFKVGSNRSKVNAALANYRKSPNK